MKISLSTPFSVAMSVYKNDNPENFRTALESVCCQSCMPSEIYLVVDGPVGHDLTQIINEFAAKYPIFTVNQLDKNGGLGNALKIAIENCKYDLIARMDSDDICAPGRFAKQLEVFKKNDVDIVGGWALGFIGDLENGIVCDGKKKLSNEELYKTLKKRSPMSHVTVMYKREAVLNAGNYMDLFYHEDYYLWARMMEAKCKFMNLPEYFVYVRFGKDQARRHGGIRYYKAEKTLRKYMLNKKLITKMDYFVSMFIRFIYQIILTPGIRNFLSTQVLRKKIERVEANKILKNNIDWDIEYLERTKGYAQK